VPHEDSLPTILGGVAHHAPSAHPYGFLMQKVTPPVPFLQGNSKVNGGDAFPRPGRLACKLYRGDDRDLSRDPSHLPSNFISVGAGRTKEHALWLIWPADLDASLASRRNDTAR